MDNSSKSYWCYLLFCISCYYPYMLRLNLMNYYFASVRHCNLCCTAGVSDMEVLAQRTLKTCEEYLLIPEKQSSLG